MKIILVDDEDLIRQLCNIFLENSFEDLKILEASSGNSAIKLLKEHSDIDLVVSDFIMPDGDGGVLYRYIRSNYENLPFLLVTSNDINHLAGFEKFQSGASVKELYLRKPISKQSFVKAVSSLLERSPELNESYKKIRIYNFWKFNAAECDIYVRLSSEKFVKIISAGSSYTRSDINKYADRQLEYLYIKECDFNAFSVSMASTPFLKLKCKRGECIDVETVKTTHAMIHELVLSVGLSNSVVDTAEKLSDSIVAFVKKNSAAVRDLLKKAQDAKDYIYDHSYMTSIICCEMVSQMEWNTRDIQNKLCMASLFHDLAISDPTLAMKGDVYPDSINGLDDKERDLFLSHTQVMAEKVREVPPFPANVDTVILQHHENVEGTGFPHKLSAQRVSPLVCTFIIAHDFVSMMYRLDFDKAKIKNEFPAFCAKYDVGNYKAVIKALNPKFE